MAAGAKQALHHAFTVLLEAGDEVLVPAPYWVSYPHLISLAGGVVVAVEAGPGLKITPRVLRNAVTPCTRVLLLNSPADPTGVVCSRTELTELAAVVIEHHLTIVSDEICDHWDFGETTFTSVAALSPQIAQRTDTIGGVSKTYAVIGWRIDWIAAPEPVAEAIAAVQSHTASALSSISQRAALGVLEADLSGALTEELGSRRAALDARGLTTLKALAGIPRIVVDSGPTGAFFLFADVSGTYGFTCDGSAISSAADFAAPHYVRISYQG